jgi:hypothetical protein
VYTIQVVIEHHVEQFVCGFHPAPAKYTVHLAQYLTYVYLGSILMDLKPVYVVTELSTLSTVVAQT